MNEHRAGTIDRSTIDRSTIDRSIIGLVRIVAGVLWLANLEWKRPPDFGRNAKNGLYKYVDGAVAHKVFGPWSWIVEHVVLKHYTLFGWSTLLIESALAVFLLLGLWTRPVALLGVANSVAIMLSVLYYPNEWPWSYYLMNGLHLLLFATAAGRSFGLDGVRAQGPAARRRAIRTLGIVAVVVGALALIVSSSVDFSAHQGKLLGWSRGELKLLWFNPLSALLTVVFGALAVLSVTLRRTLLAWVSVAGFAVMALQVLVQWRYHGGAWTGGVLGGTGANFAFWTMFAVGIGACGPTSASSPVAGTTAGT